MTMAKPSSSEYPASGSTTPCFSVGSDQFYVQGKQKRPNGTRTGEWGRLGPNFWATAHVKGCLWRPGPFLCCLFFSLKPNYQNFVKFVPHDSDAHWSARGADPSLPAENPDDLLIGGAASSAILLPR